MKQVDPMLRNPRRPVARHGANVVCDSMYFRSSVEGFESSSRRFLRAITEVSISSHHSTGAQHLTAIVYRRLQSYPYILQRWIIDIILALEAKDMTAPRINSCQTQWAQLEARFLQSTNFPRCAGGSFQVPHQTCVPPPCNAVPHLSNSEPWRIACTETSGQACSCIGRTFAP